MDAARSTTYSYSISLWLWFWEYLGEYRDAGEYHDADAAGIPRCREIPRWADAVYSLSWSGYKGIWLGNEALFNVQQISKCVTVLFDLPLGIIYYTHDYSLTFTRVCVVIVVKDSLVAVR